MPKSCLILKTRAIGQGVLSFGTTKPVPGLTRNGDEERGTDAAIETCAKTILREGVFPPGLSASAASSTSADPSITDADAAGDYDVDGKHPATSLRDWATAALAAPGCAVSPVPTVREDDLNLTRALHDAGDDTVNPYKTSNATRFVVVVEEAGLDTPPMKKARSVTPLTPSTTASSVSKGRTRANARAKTKARATAGTEACPSDPPSAVPSASDAVTVCCCFGPKSQRGKDRKEFAALAAELRSKFNFTGNGFPDMPAELKNWSIPSHHKAPPLDEIIARRATVEDITEVQSYSFHFLNQAHHALPDGALHYLMFHIPRTPFRTSFTGIDAPGTTVSVTAATLSDLMGIVIPEPPH
jgi:hypothetical protein